jgi:hypothetical protein
MPLQVKVNVTSTQVTGAYITTVKIFEVLVEWVSHVKKLFANKLLRFLIVDKNIPSNEIV